MINRNDRPYSSSFCISYFDDGSSSKQSSCASSYYFESDESNDSDGSDGSNGSDDSDDDKPRYDCHPLNFGPDDREIIQLEKLKIRQLREKLLEEQSEGQTKNQFEEQIKIKIAEQVAIKTKIQVEEIKEELDYKLKCCVCFDKSKNILFSPCMHICSCEICSTNLFNCPICRKRIRQKQKIFIS